MKIETDRSVVVDERAPTEPAPPAEHVVLVPTAPAAPQAPVEQVTPVTPVAAMSVVRVTPVASAESETVRTFRSNFITPTAVVAGLVAVALLVVGGITAARAGIDGSLDKPVVEVAGFKATALLGLIELGLGLVLLAAALSRHARAVLFIGIVGGVASLVAVFQPSIGEGSLAIERGFAVIVTISMAAIVLSALLPTIRTRSDTRRTRDLT